MGQDHFAGAFLVHIPCDAPLHWQSLLLYMGFDRDELDTSALRKALGAKKLDDFTFVLSDSKDCHSHVFVDSYEGQEERPKRYEPFTSVSIRTYRHGTAETGEGAKSVRSHEEFFTTLFNAAPKVTEVTTLARVDLYYKVPPARWRVPLIANPPKFGELESELGGITLAGLTLRFDKSPVGLSEVSLETSPSGDEDKVSLSYFLSLPRTQIDKIYDQVLEKAEHFSTLFVDAGSAKSRKVSP
jgi:hypothetical protein